MNTATKGEAGWGIAPSLRGLAWLAVLAIGGMAVLWAVDLRFNERSVVGGFWQSCVLRDQLATPTAMVMPVARLLFAWHKSSLPLAASAALAGLLLIGGMATLLSLGRGRRMEIAGDHERDSPWRRSSVPLGSAATLAGLVAASLVAGYPVCRGRLTLFVLIHVLVPMLLGGAVLWEKLRGSRPGQAAVWSLTSLLVLLSLVATIEIARRPAPENLRPLLAAIDTGTARETFVHDCTTTQWQALPEPTPPARFLDGTPGENATHLQQTDGKVWVIWTHLQEPCGAQLQETRTTASSWEVVYAATDAGAALAEF